MVVKRFAAHEKTGVWNTPVFVIRNRPWGLLQQSYTSGTLRRLDSLSRVLKAKSKKAFRMKTPSYQLTFNDAVNIWLRYWNGEFQHRIAASFDVNPGRVNEILKESRHVGSREAALSRKSA